jgi:hypothetical protein
MIQQARAQAQRVLANPGLTDLHANLPDLEAVLNAPEPTCVANVQPHSPAPVRQRGDQLGCEVTGHPNEEMTPDASTHRPHLDDHRRDARQPIGQQQGAFRELRQQPASQSQFGFAVPRDRGGQRIVHAHFQQDGDAQFGEGGASPARRRFHGRCGDLGRVRHTVLRAVERGGASRARTLPAAGGESPSAAAPAASGR